MRIIGGEYGGRKFNPPAKIPARPTTDLVKESLFNILQNIIDFENAVVLDLFAGTGNIAYEFASRGAKSIVLVEKEKTSARFIKDTFKHLNYESYQLLEGDALKALPHIAQQFDIVFADPPYSLPQMGEIPDIIFQNNLLNQDGIFVLEHSHNIDFSQHSRCFRSKKYGGSYLSFFK